MIVQAPTQGFNGFVMVSGQDVVYSTRTDESTYHPRSHRQNTLQTPFGDLLPFENNQNGIIQALLGKISRTTYLTVPMVIADGTLYEVELVIDDHRMELNANLLALPGDISPTLTLWTTHYAVRAILETCMHVTGDIEATIDHIVRYHGARREFLVHTTLGEIAARVKARGATRDIEELTYGILARSAAQ